MIRKYENDFTKEKKAESEAYSKVRKSFIPLLIISGAIVNISTLLLIFKAPYTKGNDFGNQAVFIFCVIVGLIVLGLAIPLLIITLVKGSKNKIGKREIPFKLSHY